MGESVITKQTDTRFSGSKLEMLPWGQRILLYQCFTALTKFVVEGGGGKVTLWLVNTFFTNAEVYISCIKEIG